MYMTHTLPSMVSRKKYRIRHIVKKGVIPTDSFRQEDMGQTHKVQFQPKMGRVDIGTLRQDVQE